MTPIADMVERMFSDKEPETAILTAIRAMEGVALRVALASRDASRFVTVPSQSPGAIRARRARAIRKQNQSSAKANDVAETGAETPKPKRDASRDGVTGAPTLLSSFSFCEEGPSEEGSKKKKQEGTEIVRARGQRMLAGAILTDECRDAAMQLGAAPDRIPGMWAEFIDYWVGVPGQRGVKLDWLATWRNDVRRKLERGSGNGRAKPQSLSERASILAEQARSAERAAGIDRPNEPFRRN